MTRFTTKYLLIATIIFVLALISCTSKEQKKNTSEATTNEQVSENKTSTGGVKLVESIAGVESTLKFEYDDEHRVVKVSYYYDDTNIPGDVIVFTYNNDGGIESNTIVGSLSILSYAKNGSVITQHDDYGSYSHTIDSDGNITETETKYDSGNTENVYYHYKNGNLIRMNMDGGYEEYKHDDKHTPFANCNGPRWFRFGKSHRNNIVEHIFTPEGDPLHVIYEYDKDGFPTKSFITFESGETAITTYTYFIK